jgi:hypothetical protein
MTYVLLLYGTDTRNFMDHNSPLETMKTVPQTVTKLPAIQIITKFVSTFTAAHHLSTLEPEPSQI